MIKPASFLFGIQDLSHEIAGTKSSCAPYKGVSPSGDTENRGSHIFERETHNPKDLGMYPNHCDTRWASYRVASTRGLGNKACEIIMRAFLHGAV